MVVRVSEVVREHKFGHFGTVSLDGTKIHGNGRRHNALAYGQAESCQGRGPVVLVRMVRNLSETP